ncbi:MAG: nucleotide exchange factor GrpE [Bacteroidales bacterium]|nr:nucleotide exchange factor GrpE [Bacteroidales bacterium]MBR5072689.1 nucleotide exchange factor GrpE [Bacteroidales bacterium]
MAKEEKKQAEEVQDIEQEVRQEEPQPSKKELRKEQKRIEELEKKVEELEKQLGESGKKAEDMEVRYKDAKDDYLRLMAEFETFRRRSAEDRLNLVSSASGDTIKGLLPVLDDIERAIAMLAESSDEAAKQGTDLIYNKLMAYLKSKGLSVIEAKGEKFDVDFHEAVAQFPVQDEAQKGMVIDVTQTGYLLNGKVLRYAKVVVGA